MVGTDDLPHSTIGSRIYALRTGRTPRMTQRALAEAAGISIDVIQKLEQGRKKATRISTLVAIAKALDVDMTALLSRSTIARSPASSANEQPGRVDMHRRLFLEIGSIAAASVGAAGLEPIGRLLDELTARPPTWVDLPEVQAVEAAADLYTQVDLAHGGGMAAAFAVSSLRWATDLLDCRMVDKVRDRLRSAVGLLADRVGWAVYDSGDVSRAIRLLTFALGQSALGPDRDLRAHIMLDLSTVLTDSGRPHDGVEVLRMALGDERISSAERANLHAVCARHCATAGLREAGLRHVALAEDAAARGDDAIGPDWARRITTSGGHLDSALGLALFQLGDDGRAQDRLTEAVGKLGAGRTRTGLRCRTRLAMLHLRHGARDRAEAEARRIVADSADIRSTRITRDVGMLIDSIRGTGMVDLADELAALQGRAG